MLAEPFTQPKSRYRPRADRALVAASLFDRSAEVLTVGLAGIEAQLVRVTARLDDGPASFEVAGFSEPRMRETRVRVRAALQGLGADLATGRLRVDLDHPELVAGGTADFAIAVAVLAVLGRLDAKALRGMVFMGELSLTGSVRSARGVLPMLLGVAKRGVRLAVVPRENATEAALAPETNTALVAHLADLVRHLSEGAALERPAARPLSGAPAHADLADIRGLTSAKRALEIAAAGGHALLMEGPPGAGRTMLARRLPGLLPELTHDERLEATSIHSVAGLLSTERGFLADRPFRAPHHTVSAAGLVGGGDPIRPGEVSLAHLGTLFLDEALEFKGAVLEALAYVLRDGRATIMRRGQTARFPAGAQLVCGTTPCPCGYAGSEAQLCTCLPERITRYRARLALPVFALTDLRITIAAENAVTLRTAPPGEPSAVVRERVTTARAMAMERTRPLGTPATNAHLLPDHLDRVARPDATGEHLLAAAEQNLGLGSADRGRILRVARTIADLDGKDAVTGAHVAEAIAITPAVPLRIPNGAGGGADAA
jgi:magnesium chelatase family protein